MIRTLYVGQQASIVTGPTGSRTTGYLPVSSASCEVSRPVEAVTAFGRLGSLALAQTNVTTCKSSIKAYLTSGAAVGITAAFLSSLTGDAVNGTQTAIKVTPNGFSMNGILTSLGIDMALGGFGTADFAFNGLGQPTFDTLVSNATSEPGSNNSPASIVPVTMAAVGGNVTGLGCANSFKFSLDMPTDTLACLGDAPDGLQASINSVIATKPPYKATITLEGFGVDLGSTGLTSPFQLGALKVTLPNAILTSKSFNNAVGTANASYNLTIEDTTATFS
jgi:hypothetical protein